VIYDLASWWKVLLSLSTNQPSLWIEEAVVEVGVGVAVLIIIIGQMIGADIETETVIIEEDTTTTITTADTIEEMIIESGWNVSVGNAWLGYELRMKQKREEIQ